MKGYIEATGVWNEADQRKTHDQRFRAGDYRVITYQGQDVGVLALEVTGAYLNLNQIFIQPAFQGLGIGADCMSIIHRMANELELDVWLQIRKLNTRALSFYTRLGYEHLAETELHLQLTKSFGTEESTSSSWSSAPESDEQLMATNKPTDYEGEISRNYNASRSLLPETLDVWIELIQQHAPSGSELQVLDLGCGTGRFCQPLAEALDATVIGVEPSNAMRAIAEREIRRQKVVFMEGSAESIPLDDDSCDVVWMSMVIHHFPDLDKAVQEIRRIIKPTGVVQIRGAYRNRLHQERLYEFFPSALTIDKQRVPTIEFVQSAFIRSGFELKHSLGVQQVVDRNFPEYVDRIGKRGISTFQYISDDDFNLGMQRMKEAIAFEEPDQPITKNLDFMVFAPLT